MGLLKNIKKRVQEKREARKEKKKQKQELKAKKKEAKIAKIEARTNKINAKAQVKQAKAQSIADGSWQSPVDSIVGGAKDVVSSFIGRNTATPDEYQEQPAQEQTNKKNLIAWIGGGVVGLFILIFGIVSLIKR